MGIEGVWQSRIVGYESGGDEERTSFHIMEIMLRGLRDVGDETGDGEACHEVFLVRAVTGGQKLVIISTFICE